MFVAAEESFENCEPWRKRRPRVESQYLKWAYIIVFVASFCGYLLMVAQVTGKADESVKSFWAPGRFELTDDLNQSLSLSGPGCFKQQRIEIRQWEPNVLINEESRDYIMAEAAGLIRMAVYATGAALFAGLLNKILFFLNVHEVSSERWVISKGYLILLEIGLIAWSLAALEQPTSQSDAISSYLGKCAPGRNHVWSNPPFIVMYVMHGITLLLYAINWGLYLQRNYTYEVRTRSGTTLRLKPWPVVRRYWRAIGTVLTTRPPDAAPPGAESQQTLIIDSVQQEITALRKELLEITTLYRQRGGQPHL